ncbi:MAG: signal peptidase I [Micrococcales bacterium]|nr:signal peptidase I [Micrococcales bacterium]MCL2666891.1 signal peptidase I [Micrococcales bacterium]
MLPDPQVVPDTAACEPSVSGRHAQEPGSSTEHRARSRGGRHQLRRPSGPLAWLRETAIIMASALVLSWVVKTFLVQAFYIPSESMYDTLVLNDRILVSKLTPGPFDLSRGDIVVFADPGGWLGSDDTTTPTGLNKVLSTVGLAPANSNHLVKRVIGLPGDVVRCDEACKDKGGPVTVNGVAIDESAYIKPGSTPSGGKAFCAVVPEGHVWVMGDNRQHSSDSRWNQNKPGGGAVPVSNVVGVVFVTIWPLDRVSAHKNPGSTFADVPPATTLSCPAGE